MMQRRAFSLSATGGVLAAALGANLLSADAQAQARAFKSGSDFLTLDKPAATEAGPGKLEVVEFFWYGCPHCNTFEPQLEAWIQTVPKDVAIRRVPVAFRPDFEPNQRLYYVLEEMGKVPELHKKVFQTIHGERQPLHTTELVTAWAVKQGIDKTKFTEMYNSFSVTTRVRKATQLQDQYQVDGVPALGIAGRYFTSGSLAKTMERALQVTDYLIGQARKAP